MSNGVNRPAEPAIRVRRGRIRSQVRPPQAREPRDLMVRGGIISGRDVGAQTPLPDRPPPVGVDPRMVVDPGIYIPPDFVGDPTFVPILRVPGVDPDPPGVVGPQFPFPSLEGLRRTSPGLYTLIKLSRSPIGQVAGLLDLVTGITRKRADTGEWGLLESLICRTYLGATSIAECKLIAGISVIGNALLRGVGLGPVGRFIKTQKGFVFPKPSKLKPATPTGPPKTNIPVPLQLPIEIPGPLGPVEPLVKPLPIPPLEAPPMRELPVRPDLAPITAPPTVAPRPAEIPVQTPGPLVSPQPGPVPTTRTLSIPRPSLGTRTGRIVLPGRSLLTDFLFGVAFGGLARSPARQRVEAPVRELVDLVRTPSPVGSVTPLAPPALAPFTQPLMQRARQAQQDCVEVKRRRRRKGKCREGFFEELPGRTRFTTWRTVNCATGRTIKEFR